MDWILDKLQKNNIGIDMKTLSHHINYLIKHHDQEYGHIAMYFTFNWKQACSFMN